MSSSLEFNPFTFPSREHLSHTYFILEWDAASSARLSSHRFSEESEDGFTKVQGPKAKRQNQVPALHPTRTPNQIVGNGQKNGLPVRPPPANDHTRARAGVNRGRGSGRGNGISDHVRQRPDNHIPPPNRSSTQRPTPKSAAEFASQQGAPATGEMHCLSILLMS